MVERQIDCILYAITKDFDAAQHMNALKKHLKIPDGVTIFIAHAIFLFLINSVPLSASAQQIIELDSQASAQNAAAPQPEIYDFLRDIPILTPPFSGDVRALIDSAFGSMIEQLSYQDDISVEQVIAERVWVKFVDLDIDDSHPAKEIFIYFSGGEACELQGACTNIYRFGLNKWRPVLTVVGLANVSNTIAGGAHQIIITGSGNRHPVWSFDGRSYKFAKTIDASQLQTVAEALERENAAKAAEVMATSGSADWSFGQDKDDFPLALKGYGKIGFVLQCLGLASGFHAGVVTPECDQNGDQLTFETSTRRRFDVTIAPRGRGICTGSISFAEAEYIGKANTLTVSLSPNLQGKSNIRQIIVDLKGSFRALNRIAAEGGCRAIR